MSAVIGSGRRAAWQAQPRLGQSVIIEPGGGKTYLAPSRNA
ncbi:MAG TPA: hypothetical protein VJT08_10240 [Terriglobales bacterium]|jgi:hypothetical protein|nr:hypothetical protein [Terriglobales bacterium]